MSFHVIPPFVLYCHCTVGAGVPDPEAVRVTVVPALTARFDGCAPIEGATTVAVDTGTGAVRVVVVPSPSWPRSLRPQHAIAPPDRRTQT